jgi:hypothetical protein
MASSSKSFFVFTGGLIHSSRKVTVPAGIGSGRSTLKCLVALGIVRVCCNIMGNLYERSIAYA